MADLRLLLEIEAGPVAGDPTALPAPDLTPGKGIGRLIATPRLSQAGPLPEDVAVLFEAAVDAAGDVFGLPVERIELATLLSAGNPIEDWPVLCATEHVHRLGRDFVKANLDQMSASARGFLEFGLGISLDSYMAARRRRFAFVKVLDELLGEDAVILSPTNAASGFLADGRLTPEGEPGVLPGDVFNTELANITGHPALSLPAGISPNGVPFGLQVIGPRFRDGMLLELAALWEQGHAWPRIAPGYESFEQALGLSL